MPALHAYLSKNESKMLMADVITCTLFVMYCVVYKYKVLFVRIIAIIIFCCKITCDIILTPIHANGTKSVVARRMTQKINT